MLIYSEKNCQNIPIVNYLQVNDIIEDDPCSNMDAFCSSEMVIQLKK